MASDGKITIDTGIDQSGFEKDAKALEQKLKSLADQFAGLLSGKDTKIELDVDADTSGAKEKIQDVASTVESLDPVVDIDADPSSGQAAAQGLEGEIDGMAPEMEISGDASTVSVEASGAAAEAEGMNPEMSIGGDASAVSGEASGAAAEVEGMNPEIQVWKPKRSGTRSC